MVDSRLVTSLGFGGMPSGPRGKRQLHTSRKLTATATGVSEVEVQLSLGDPDDLTIFTDALNLVSYGSVARTSRSAARTGELFHAAIQEYLRLRFDHEIDEMVSTYRVLLRESLITGDDPKLKVALNRARLQERILASTTMADQAEACELLGLSVANPSATMKRKEERGEVLRFTRDGRAVYPLLQFDVEGRRAFPAMARLMALKPETWSDFRLLHWLTRPHLDFDGAPADALGSDEAAVIAAFTREIEPAVHG